MLRISKQVNLSPEKALQKAKEFFGPGGIGLEIEAECESNIRFAGGGGYVFVEACGLDKGAEITLETREWEYQVKEFMHKV